MADGDPQFFRIRNWHSFQHYSERRNIWVKLYVEMLSSRDWIMLDADGRNLMIVCMLIGANADGKVPNDPAYLQAYGHLRKVNLKPLVDIGFLECPEGCYPADNRLLESCYQPDSLEKNREDIDKKESLVGSAAPMPTRNVYDLLFEQFWKGYPTDRLMSKKLASTRWSRLSLEDRKAVIDSLPAFRAYCSSKPDYRPVHAERYLSQRRFDGFGAAPAQEASASVALAEENTKKLEAMWEAQRVSGTGTQP